ncbi:trans-2-enoyl-CoA reductase [Monoraphidium neglectum]|uniref:Trans-2-enoyl-CoA reductase n=1 Tax=Monoraphidium neglectum TaxID=145388 RepID=A0A0D2L7E3_9CHLO|nr:trans-2-enoyl-CoA reductase [Monoraphidium neglectum]KIZ02769.1 trans-2-enoyl-CoA reductase [Monoraphidium neglectum]|eukprot:XP_013901788.1 trans-2-enoyl-CoA reductase [Monoraphidium neglectum]
MASALTFAAHGEPEDVLQLQQDDASGAAPLGPKQVRLQLIAAPINPSDINTVQGKYPLKPLLPGVPGHEGVMRVEAAGAEVSTLRPGDRVVPLLPAVGTWRSSGVFEAEGWHAVPEGLPDDAAATLCINPPTAVCMLEHFVELKAGDVVVQNGATSAVGQV